MYNEELLSMTGILCRVLYEDEIAQIDRLHKELLGVQELEQRTAHALKHFTFKPSTPNARVGQIIESRFFSCSAKPLPILSSLGVLSLSSVRVPDPATADFIKLVPVVPTRVLNDCEYFFNKAKANK